MFAGMAGVYSSEAPLRYSTLEFLITIIELGWKSLQETNPSLLQKFVNYGQKSYLTFAPYGTTYPR